MCRDCIDHAGRRATCIDRAPGFAAELAWLAGAAALFVLAEWLARFRGGR